jgi:hypothetical protein
VLELGQRREDPEDELPGRGGRIYIGALTREHLEADAALGEILRRVDQVPEAG